MYPIRARRLGTRLTCAYILSDAFDSGRLVQPTHGLRVCDYLGTLSLFHRPRKFHVGNELPGPLPNLRRTLSIPTTPSYGLTGRAFVARTFIFSMG